MGFTKRELIQFLDGLVELASEENKVKAVLVKEKFISDFERIYGCFPMLSWKNTTGWIMKWRTARRRSRSRTITSGYSRRKNASQQLSQNGKWIFFAK